MTDKEKLTLHRQLLSPPEATADLSLLEAKAPRHPGLATFRLAPRRHADAILYDLLDVATAAEIAANRQQPERSPRQQQQEEPRQQPEKPRRAAEKKKPSARKRNTPASTG